MKSLVLKGLMLASIASLLLISCNGGGSHLAGGGIEVNGTDFDTSNAEVIINGVLVGVGDEFVEDNIQIGMLVTVEGLIKNDESAVADRVIYSSNVVGWVAAMSGIDPDTQEFSLEVLGQTVVVNLITRFKGTSYDTIDVDDVVVVSGYRNFDGSIRATFIEKTGVFSAPSQVEVTGFIKNLDTGLETFEINDLTVNYSTIADDLPDGIPANNQLVEVEGTFDTSDGVLNATDIELGDELAGEEVDEIEIMDFVTEIISVNDIIKFKIGHQEVHADANPEIVEYVDGEPANITLGQKLEAEGSFEGGILTAWEIEFWKPDQIELEDTVTEVISDTEFILGDQVVQINDETVYENIGPEQIEVGIEIEVKGVPVDIDYSTVVADKVSFEEEE